MLNEQIDSDMPVGKLTRVENFLPPPSQLIFPSDTVKITISLSRKSVEYLKQQDKKHHIKYQRMIREVVDRYVAHHTVAK